MITAPPVNPGTFDRRCALRYPVSARDGIGADVPAYAAADFSPIVWARWLSRNSRDFVSAAARHSELSGVLRIRWRADVMPGWRAAIDSLNYRLLADPIEVGRREYLDLALTIVDRPAWLVDSSGVRLTDDEGNYLTA